MGRGTRFGLTSDPFFFFLVNDFDWEHVFSRHTLKNSDILPLFSPAMGLAYARPSFSRSGGPSSSPPNGKLPPRTMIVLIGIAAACFLFFPSGHWTSCPVKAE